jgi:phosphoribosylformylglycinamidine synthase
MLKSGVLDPQGKAVQSSLATLGYTNTDAVRIGKLIELTVATTDRQAAERQVDEMCRKLLANPVIESYTFSVVPVGVDRPSGSEPTVPPGVAY